TGRWCGGQPTGAQLMPDEASRQQPSARRRARALGSEKRGAHRARLAFAVFGALLGLGPPEVATAQRAEPFHISVAAMIVALPASETSLAIEIGPLDALPKKSFVSVRGLPAAVSLTGGRAIGMGSWTVPLSALGALKANIPADIRGRSEIIISLI